MNDNLDNWFNKNLSIVRRGVSFNNADLDVVRNCIKQRRNIAKIF